MRLLPEAGLALLVSVVVLAGGAGADTVTFRDGTPTPFLGGPYEGTEDAMVPTNAGTFEDQNFGARTNMEVGQVLPGYLRRDLVRFDVTALDGEFFSIDAVTLRLHVTDTDSLDPGDVTGAGVLDLYRLTEANEGWVEGTETSAMTGAPPDTGQVTWAQRLLGSEDWAGSAGAGTAGVDHVDTILASASFDASTTAPGSAIDLGFEDVSFFPDWVAGMNPGLLLRVENEGFENAVSFGTRENGDDSLLPELIVEFSVVPEPAHALQLLTGGLVLVAAGRRRGPLSSSLSA